MESSRSEEVAEEWSRAEILHCSTKSATFKPSLNTTSWAIYFPILLIGAKLYYMKCKIVYDVGVCVGFKGSLPSQRDWFSKRDL